METQVQDRRVTATFGAGRRDEVAQFTRTDSGGGRLSGIRVLKTGTFIDSYGYEMTFDDVHLEQIVFHYNLLKNENVFPNVPWRVNHGRNADEVIGYILDLRKDGSYLIADVDITEPDAADKWERGTYRSRSAEVGFYEANDQRGYWPTLMGVAFVDIPAVEGLFSKPNSKESTNVNEIEFALACGYAQALEDQTAEVASVNAAYYAQGLADAKVEFGSGDRPPFVFSIGDEKVADYRRVQEHITTLEAFRSETLAAGRTSFVEALAEAKKIAAPQVDGLKALALSMTDEQFNQFKASYEVAPVLSLFANHAEGISNPGGEGTQDDEKSILEAIVLNHRRAGMPEDKIQNTPSFQRLQALKAQ